MITLNNIIDAYGFKTEAELNQFCTDNEISIDQLLTLNGYTKEVVDGKLVLVDKKGNKTQTDCSYKEESKISIGGTVTFDDGTEYKAGDVVVKASEENLMIHYNFSLYDGELILESQVWNAEGDYIDELMIENGSFKVECSTLGGYFDNVGKSFHITVSCEYQGNTYTQTFSVTYTIPELTRLVDKGGNEVATEDGLTEDNMGSFDKLSYFKQLCNWTSYYLSTYDDMCSYTLKELNADVTVESNIFEVDENKELVLKEDSLVYDEDIWSTLTVVYEGKTFTFKFAIRIKDNE